MFLLRLLGGVSELLAVLSLFFLRQRIYDIVQDSNVISSSAQMERIHMVPDTCKSSPTIHQPDPPFWRYRSVQPAHIPGPGNTLDNCQVSPPHHWKQPQTQLAATLHQAG